MIFPIPRWKQCEVMVRHTAVGTLLVKTDGTMPPGVGTWRIFEVLPDYWTDSLTDKTWPA